LGYGEGARVKHLALPQASQDHLLTDMLLKFYEYWQVPTNSVQCDAATNHLITNAVFNLSSDCIMIAIALPMFLRLQLPYVLRDHTAVADDC